jgi:hypothetical protein
LSKLLTPNPVRTKSDDLLGGRSYLQSVGAMSMKKKDYGLKSVEDKYLEQVFETPEDIYDIPMTRTLVIQ